MFKLKPLLVATAACCVSLSNLANAETTVRMMHIETDPNVLGIWQDVAKDFEAQNPDIKN
ncbi:hypothetical protein JCM19233_6045 [Vibrio astriarenae]|nr:hypothetical protein JCM19233_6045 [Vibrio sp. C7]